MKYLFFNFFCVLMVFSAKAQLSNTKWKATLNIDGPKNVIFDFKKDTLSVYAISDSSLIETMLFTDKDHMLTMQKISGQSDCDNATIGKYRYSPGHDTTRISMISDDCLDRSSVLNGSKWFIWKNHVAVKVDPSILKKYVGVYQLDADHELIISFENGELMVEGPKVDLPKLPLIPESKTRFFLKVAGVELDFIQDSSGKTIEMISHEEKDVHLKKIK
ncbi:MAG: DUF3471 domain-containing protein [Chitinophagales bacterium]